jgi:hypothetical protein
MAKRLNTRQTENARDAIKTGLLLEFLQKHALKGTKCNPTRIQAARILLGKVMPDMKAIELGNTEDGPLEIAIVKHAED